MKIVSWNVNSLKARAEHVANFLDFEIIIDPTGQPEYLIRLLIGFGQFNHVAGRHTMRSEKPQLPA